MLRGLLATFFVACSLLPVWLFPRISDVISRDASRNWPLVPMVTVYPPIPRTDVVSSVAILVGAIVVLAVSLLSIEIAKAILVFSGGKYRLGYAVLLALQCVIPVELLSTHTRDWWVYILSLTGIHPLHKLSWSEPVPLTLNTSPWLATLLAIVFAVVLFVSSKRDKIES